MSDKMREVPPITDETYKALMVALGMPNNRSLLSALQQIANHATQRAAWQAAQSVPPKPDYSVTQLQRMKSLMGVLGLATDESLEAFCLDADRQLSRAITAMEKFMEKFMAKQSVPVVVEVVDYDDDIKKRMRFYAVNDLISLSRIQSEHIARLQKKLPTMRDEQPRNPRSGGE